MCPNWVLACTFFQSITFTYKGIFSPLTRAIFVSADAERAREQHSQGLPKAGPRRPVGETLSLPQTQGKHEQGETRLLPSSGNETLAAVSPLPSEPRASLQSLLAVCSEGLAVSSMFARQIFSSLSYTFRNTFVSDSSRVGNILFLILRFPPEKRNRETNTEHLEIQ